MHHITYVLRSFAPCAERGDGAHPVVHSESDELQQGVAAGEGVPAFRQHGLFRERDALVQGIRDEDGHRASLGFEQGAVRGAAQPDGGCHQDT